MLPFEGGLMRQGEATNRKMSDDADSAFPEDPAEVDEATGAVGATAGRLVSLPASAARSERMRTRIHRTLGSIEPTWRFLERSGICHGFQSFDWIACWY